jgi:hypothetical protein
MDLTPGAHWATNSAFVSAFQTLSRGALMWILPSINTASLLGDIFLGFGVETAFATRCTEEVFLTPVLADEVRRGDLDRHHADRVGLLSTYPKIPRIADFEGGSGFAAAPFKIGALIFG